MAYFTHNFNVVQDCAGSYSLNRNSYKHTCIIVNVSLIELEAILILIIIQTGLHVSES